MIFNRIKIENFGILHNFELELTSGLNLFARPNEAGKSTLLEFVRRLFWGYPDRRKKCNLYPQMHDSGRYGGEIHITMDSGRKLRLERYGLKGQLRCFDLDENRELPASEWDAAHLAGCSETFFRNVFAITLDELVSLESIETSEIKQLLYGADLGINPKKISLLAADLKNSADRIFRSRGSCELNTALQKYDGLLQEYTNALNAEKQIGLISAEQNSLTVESAELAAALQELTGREQLLLKAESRRQLMQEIAELQQQRTALPPLPESRRISELENLLNTLPEPEMIASCQNAVADLEKTAAGERNVLDTMLDTAGGSPVAGSVITKLSQLEKLLTAEVENYLSMTRRRKILLLCTMLPLLAGVGAALLSRMPQLLCLALSAILPLTLLLKLKIKFPPHAGEAEALRSEVEKQLAVKGDFSCDKLSELNFRLDSLQRKTAECTNQQQQLNAMFRKQQAFELKCRELQLSPPQPEQIRTQLQLWQNTADRLRLIDLQLAAKSSLLATITLPEEISALSAEAIAENFAGLNTRRRQLEEKRLAAANRRGQLENELLLLKKHGSSAAAGTRLDTAEANIRELTGEYLTASIARELLELAVKRFESEHQPAVLEFTSEIFSGLTGGRYTNVWRQLSSGELLFRDQHSNLDKHFDELSRGCREQLLLALRLALIQHRELNAEKIPVILDDVLVDFDRQRRSAAISALRKFAADRQVILFSCREIPEAAE